jgi:hypothetical protein
MTPALGAGPAGSLPQVTGGFFWLEQSARSPVRSPDHITPGSLQR